MPKLEPAENEAPQLTSVSVSKIEDGDVAETCKMLQACASDGGFYLSLSSDADANRHGVSGRHPLLALADHVFGTAKELFSMPLEDKMHWEMDLWGELQIGGYKPVGKHSGVRRGGQDGFENFLVPTNALLDMHPNPNPYHPDWPTPLKDNLDQVTEFGTLCSDLAVRLLVAMSKAIDPPPATPYQLCHRPGKPSTTSLAMLHYLPRTSLVESHQVGHMAHTDVGSLTLLFTSTPGLEVYRPSSEEWVPVIPREGTIFINVGDSLRFISGGRFNSCLHRVVPLAGKSLERYSLAFFCRPELTAISEDTEGRQWTGEEWHRAKYKVFRATNHEQEKSSLLTGRKGFLGELMG
ncbi:Clavaminate synthase-like protein [Coniochaeta ligniaria NRRL 30616]|uniref:Clavaminate synthase-like protein n=1 Tax=Coniochaeta ligniaria NRRL 30616 TaxID=1408157 RepID=A0A1J7JIM3_9PEZI|nr:Clavaminate synthase-like protein [Coniochaeta ligniaria NRRL 30616]